MKYDACMELVHPPLELIEQQTLDYMCFLLLGCRAH